MLLDACILLLMLLLACTLQLWTHAGMCTFTWREGGGGGDGGGVGRERERETFSSVK
jgi:hypothetical protein